MVFMSPDRGYVAGGRGGGRLPCHKDRLEQETPSSFIASMSKGLRRMHGNYL